jgi:arginase
MDLGAGRRGVDMGPSAIRIAGLDRRLNDLGYGVREMGTVTARGPEITPFGESRARYLPTVVDVCREVRGLVLEALDDDVLPLVLGGDHSIAIGTVSAVAEHHAAREETLGLIWVDAHTDMNTPETTPSGNVHGMGLASLVGRGPDELVRLSGREPAVSAEHVVVLGARSIDPTEKPFVHESGIHVITMSRIDERGMAFCMDEALERVNTATGGFHLSFDLDVIDPMVAPGVGTPVAGGITFREGHLVCEKAARNGHLVSLEVVELNPVLDSANRTGRLAVDLIASALGQTIL